MQPDFLTQKFAEALLAKRASVAALTDAEKSCHEWESILRHFGNEREIQEVIRTVQTCGASDAWTGPTDCEVFSITDSGQLVSDAAA